MIGILILREKQKRTEVKDLDEKDRDEFRKERLEAAAGVD